ncbi:universal stress protein [Saccharothrix algeriensis]|uniref:Nucleotide-binding universal stress UspA family protein n=1 Tax=Saccharothrix algeriensis TaxID=173560 RepID=A0A8T8HZS1_9PSEU|nr:universal stress protein [Saccharothrix algeriensis]MBM7809677.1 nucleotide-binding universal stress UspA family protein [Saccharothrix algeriensis]QTR03976.1 universal stress protein [Saccharothrix algeriensis]
MTHQAIPTAPPVIVAGDDSPWGRAALRWAAEHADAIGAPLEVHPPTEDLVRDLLVASARGQALVVGHRGDGASFGLGRLVLPLVDHAACDVVVVRGTPEALRHNHHRVTALVSGNPSDELLLARAVECADRQHATLRVLYAVPPLPLRADDPEWPVSHADRLLRGVRHTSVLARMHPHEAITRYADTDLLVLADRGPLTRTALHHARCPVLVAHRSPVETARDRRRPARAALTSPATGGRGPAR